MFLPHPRVKLSIVGSLCDREVACSASDRQGSSFESCVWRTVSSHSSHHPQEVLLAQFNLYVHKGGIKPDSFHFLLQHGSQFAYCHLERLVLQIFCSTFAVVGQDNSIMQISGFFFPVTGIRRCNDGQLEYNSICQLKLGVLPTLDCEHWVSRFKFSDRLVKE